MMARLFDSLTRNEWATWSIAEDECGSLMVNAILAIPENNWTATVNIFIAMMIAILFTVVTHWQGGIAPLE